jgi:hypothetical protein
MQRKITSLFFMLVLFALGVNAQSTYDHPWPGATHHYITTVTDSENDNPVRWWVSTDALGNNKAVYNTDYTFVTAGYNSGTNQLEGTALYDVQLTWSTGLAADDTFYVAFEVDNQPSSLGCTNRMTLRVIITTAFNALAWDVTGSATPGTVIIGGPGDDTEDPTCPGTVVNPLWDGSKHTDIGNSELVFRVNKQNTLLNWHFEFAVTEGTAQAFSIDSIKIVDDMSNELTVLNQTGDLKGGDVSVNSTEDWVLAYVYIRNQMGVTFNINFDLITANNLTYAGSGPTIDYDGIPADNHADHTIAPMPIITNFGGN